MRATFSAISELVLGAYFQVGVHCVTVSGDSPSFAVEVQLVGSSHGTEHFAGDASLGGATVRHLDSRTALETDRHFVAQVSFVTSVGLDNCAGIVIAREARVGLYVHIRTCNSSASGQNGGGSSSCEYRFDHDNRKFLVEFPTDVKRLDVSLYRCQRTGKAGEG